MDYANFAALNSQALEYLNERAEPDTALQILEQALPRRRKYPRDSADCERGQESGTIADQIKKLNARTTLHYNMACCCQRLDLLREAIDHLETTACFL